VLIQVLQQLQVLAEAVEILLLQVVLQFKMVVLVEAEAEAVEVPLQ
tara:strand:+ start:142 stop:279 length:138 start_codon:yes stop_codon:yes gene_type:complete